MCWAPAERRVGHCQDPERALGEWWQLRAVGVRVPPAGSRQLNHPSTSSKHLPARAAAAPQQAEPLPSCPAPCERLSGEPQPPQPAEQCVPSQGLNRELSSCALPWIPAGMEK